MNIVLKIKRGLVVGEQLSTFFAYATAPTAHSLGPFFTLCEEGKVRDCVCMCVYVCVCLPPSGDPSAALKVLLLPGSAKNTDLVYSNVHFKCTRISMNNVIQNHAEKNEKQILHFSTNYSNHFSPHRGRPLSKPHRCLSTKLSCSSLKFTGFPSLLPHFRKSTLHLMKNKKIIEKKTLKIKKLGVSRFIDS